MSPTRLHILRAAILSFANALIWTTLPVYFVQAVGMNPAQLVLVGTALEISILVCEIPTGIVADLYSRRGSTLIGYALMGVAYGIMGAFPVFAAALVGHLVWGVGHTFTSGAYNAWLVDEVGQEQAGTAFVRGARWERVGGILGIAGSVLLSLLALSVPILVGAALHLALAAGLAFVMPETGFKPTPNPERSTWGKMADTFRAGARILRSSPALLSLVGYTFFLGLFSETWDRLWQAHLITTFDIGGAWRVPPVAALAALNIGLDLILIGATRWLETRVNMAHGRQVSRALLLITGVMIAGLLGYGAAPALGFAVAAFYVFNIARGLIGPLYDTWQNQLIPEQSAVRATVLSMGSQTDAIGQIGGGPPAAILGNASLRLAFFASAGMLSPALLLLNRARRAVVKPTPAPSSPTGMA